MPRTALYTSRSPTKNAKGRYTYYYNGATAGQPHATTSKVVVSAKQQKALDASAAAHIKYPNVDRSTPSDNSPIVAGVDRAGNKGSWSHTNTKPTFTRS